MKNISEAGREVTIQGLRFHRRRRNLWEFLQYAKGKETNGQRHRVQRNSSQRGKISKEALYGNNVFVLVVAACFIFSVR